MFKGIKEIQPKPQIDFKSDQLAKTLHITPLYKRVEEEVERQHTNLESLRNLYLQSTKCDSNESSKVKKVFKDNLENTLAWIHTQEDWRKKKERNIQLLYTEIKEDNKDIEEYNNMKSHLQNLNYIPILIKATIGIIILIVKIIITLIHLGLHYLI